MAEYRASMMKNNYDNEDNQPNNDSNDDTDNNVDVIAVALEAYIEAIVNPEYEHFKFSHYINDHAIIYDRFNGIISLLFEMDLNPAMKSAVTESCVVECIFLDDKTTHLMNTLQHQEKVRRESLGEQSEVLVLLIMPGIFIFAVSLAISST
jgi:hypothetical protein